MNGWRSLAGIGFFFRLVMCAKKVISMIEVLTERIENIHGVRWVRNHATDLESNALCCSGINTELSNVNIGQGKVTCIECIELIKKCKKISEDDISDENEDEVLRRRFSESKK